MENNTKITIDNTEWDLGNYTIDKVFEFLKSKNIYYRVVSYNNQPCAITDDFVPGRVNLSINEGKINNLSIEGTYIVGTDAINKDSKIITCKTVVFKKRDDRFEGLDHTDLNQEEDGE